MINHTVLFPGKDIRDQWTQISSVLRTPDDHFINQLEPIGAVYVRSLPQHLARAFNEIVPDSNFLPETENPKDHLTRESGYTEF